ncbi:MAG TPA: MupA/Atu3671 family FMN-dependent luciferase-like monooxygenase, partial [Pseudonocardiaceae bacterium]|nr:MupA/Atu3671 family FMN-dependent luciferase-like monooxygenase [Pseudonocardiaceae bacterium]
MAAQVRRPFDLTRLPLLRTAVLRTGQDEYVLALTIHHIIADMWSVDVLLRELMALYRASAATGTPTPPAPLPVQYADFAGWQRSWLDGDALRDHLDYWTERLADAPPFLNLPTDRPRPLTRTYGGARETIGFPDGLLADVDALCQREGVTRFMALLASFAVLVSRYSGETDILIGTPVANRTRTEVENLIGCFVNTLVLRVDLANDPTFVELLRRVREVALGAFEHQDMPVEHLVEALHPRRDPARPPLFQAMFIVQNAAMSPFELPGLTVEALPSSRAATEYDLTLEFVDTGGDRYASVQYNTDIFGDDSMGRLLGHWRMLLAGAVADPERRVASLPMLTDAESARLDDWNATGAEFPRGPVHDQIARQATLTPDAVAVVHRDRQVSYAELDAAASTLAGRLRAAGVTPEVPVAVCVERSPEMIVSLLGVLKAGAAYLPVDTTLPPERVAYILEDAGVCVVVTTRTQRSRFTALPVRPILIDAGQPAPDEPDRSAAPQSSVESTVDSSDATDTGVGLAYVIYTSGSTGGPKGVMVEHRCLTNFLAAMDTVLHGPESGVWLAITSVSFDIAALELFWPLTRGWQVVVQDDGDVLPGYSANPAAAGRLDFSLFYFAVSDDQDAQDRYRLMLDGARFADRHGFSAVWTPERHFDAFGGPYPNPAVTTAALATITERVQLRAGSVVLPLHNAIRVAEEWAVIDNLSHGRVGISFASGWHANDFALAPDPAVYGRRKEAMLEQIETVRRLWRGEKVRVRNGVGRDLEVSTFPRPVQADVPVWLAAAGSPETFRRAGEVGAGILTHLLGQSLEDLDGKIAVYRQAWRAAGRSGNGHVTLMAHTYVGPDSVDVRAVVRGPFREYLRRSFGLVQALAPSLGYDGEPTEDDVEALLDLAFENYYGGAALMGTVDECTTMAERLRRLGVDDIACLIDFGVGTDDVLDSLPLLNQVRRRFDAPSTAGDTDYGVAAQVRRHGVTHMQCTPSLASILMADPRTRESLRGLHTMIVGGEALPAALAGELTATVQGRLLNM